MNRKKAIRNQVIGVVLSIFMIFAAEAKSAGNGKIAFTSTRDGATEIYVMNPDGANQVRLTNNSTVDDHPTWSPDGRLIAFLGQRPTGQFAIFTMKADGTGKTEITPVSYQPPNNLGWDYWSMSWSPDGRELVFQDRTATGEYGIHIVKADGSNRRLLSSSTRGSQPAWSPDGSKILFSRNPPGVFFFNWLFTINPDGTDLRALPTQQDYVDSAPTWSPTGDKIVFQGWNWANWEDLVVANGDGTNRQDFAYGCYDGPVCGGANFPDWSPDGNQIVFCLDGYGYNVDPEIYIKNVTGDGLRQLTNTTGDNVNPSWQSLASAATVGGRVVTPDGRGLRNATVLITDSFGVERTATTSSFGYFTFANIETAGTYAVAVSSRRYRFMPQTVQIDGNLTLPDFAGIE